MTLSTLSSPISAAPRYSTTRDASAATYGPAVAALAEALGWPLLPWQRHLADIVCQVHPSGTGWRYPTVVATTPRQCGKSSVLGAILAHRAIAFPDSHHWYTAQTGLAARDTWRKWQGKLAETMPGRWAFRMAAGEERATFKGSRGFVRAFPPTPKALHGQQGDTVVPDECWAFTPEQGEALLQAVVPTQATRPWRQLILISTAGDDESVWWRSWIERGRASVDDPSSGIAFVEYSAPDDAPHDDPETWARYHPGYPALISDEAMRAALSQFGPEGFSRGYLNRWPAVEASWRAGWPRLASDERIPQECPVFVAADASPNHRAASIVAAAVLPSGRIGVEVIETGTGVEWLLPRLSALAARHRASIVIQRTGPLGYMLNELHRAGVRVTAATSTDYGDAVARFRTLAAAGELAHANDPRLNAAVDGSVSRKVGDREVWSRKDTTTDISPLVAATFAAWQAATPPLAPVVVTLAK